MSDEEIKQPITSRTNRSKKLTPGDFTIGRNNNKKFTPREFVIGRNSVIDEKEEAVSP